MFEIRGWAECLRSSVSPFQLKKIQHELTYTPKRFSIGKKKKLEDDEVEEAVPSLHAFKMDRIKLYLPIAWAKANMPFPWEDKTSMGIEAPELDASKIVPRSREQKKFFDTLLATLVRDGTAFGKGQTGSGKTIAGLYVAAMLGGRTLIVVPQSNMLEQWKEEIVEKLGLRPNQVGIVRQDKCDMHCPIMIGIIHSLAARAYPAAFYQSIRTIIFDEADMLGAPSFSKVMGKFPSRYKLALTATPHRADGCSGLFTSYFGSNFVESAQTVLDCQILPVLYAGGSYKTYVKRSYNMGVLTSAVAANANRNGFLAGWIRWLHNKGRSVLGLSDRIAQCEEIRMMLAEMGIHAVIYNSKTTKEEWKTMKENARVILATRGVFRRATNVPRLDAGIELTPSAQPEQEIGRIRRPCEGKGVPLWITVLDGELSFLQTIINKRLKRCLELPGVSVKEN